MVTLAIRPTVNTERSAESPRNYELRITPRAERDLDKLEPKEFELVDDEIQALSENPRPSGFVKLGKETFRIRVRRWRVIYLIDDEKHLVIIDRVKKRNESTYRRL